MTNAIIVTIIVIVVAIFIGSIIYFLKISTSKKLVSYLYTKNLKEFEKTLDSFSTKLLFSKKARLWWRLHEAFLKQDKKDITKYFEELDNTRLSYTKRCELYMQAFQYFISQKDKYNSKKYLEKIQETKNDRFIEETQIVYDVYIDKSFSHLDKFLSNLEEKPQEYRGIDELLIAEMYKNMGDMPSYNKYYSLAKQHISELDKKIANSEVVKNKRK